MKYYKVVSINANDELYSMIIKGEGRVQYFEQQWVRAQDNFYNSGYHLLVFSNLHEAKAFQDTYRYRKSKLYEAEIFGIMDHLKVKKYEIEELKYSALRNFYILKPPSEWSQNTVMVKQIKLTKEIQEEGISYV